MAHLSLNLQGKFFEVVSLFLPIVILIFGELTMVIWVHSAKNLMLKNYIPGGSDEIVRMGRLKSFHSNVLIKFL